MRELEKQATTNVIEVTHRSNESMGDDRVSISHVGEDDTQNVLENLDGAAQLDLVIDEKNFNANDSQMRIPSRFSNIKRMPAGGGTNNLLDTSLNNP